MNKQNNNSKYSQMNKEQKGNKDKNADGNRPIINSDSNEKKDTNTGGQKNNHKQPQEHPKLDELDKKESNTDNKGNKEKFIDFQITPRAIDLIVYALKTTYMSNTSIIVLPNNEMAIKYMNMSRPLIALLKIENIEIIEGNMSNIKSFLNEQNDNIDKLVQVLGGETVKKEDFFDIPKEEQNTDRKGGNTKGYTSK